MLGSRRLVTLSLEGTWLRLVGVRGREVEYWADIPFDERLLHEGFIGDRQALGAVIGETFRSRGLPRSRVVAALPGLKAVARLVTLPGPISNLEAAIAAEAPKVLPETLVDFNLYWQALDSRSSPRLRVFLLATPREAVLSLVETLRLAGIQPLALDLKPLALYRALPVRDAIIANLESTTLDVVIVSNDLPVLLRTVFLGDGTAAPEFLRGRLTDELARTIRYYQDTHRANPLPAGAPVFLSGDDVSEAGLVATVEALTGHPVEPLRVPFTYPRDFPVERYLVNLGLALKSL